MWHRVLPHMGMLLLWLLPACVVTAPLTLVSFVSPSIAMYATYSTAINALFAQHKRYLYRVMTPEMGHDHEPFDRRWNRVKILLSFMEDAATAGYMEANTTTYYMWMDADLIVLDFHVDIESFIDENKDHDIIISSEWHAETGIANTGCFIIKHSIWSYNFLLKWWNNYDHLSNHDQIYFDVLYKSMPSLDQGRIKVLPTEALNSIPPAMLHQESHHQFLHLMGERDELRRLIFERAWNTVAMSRDAYADDFVDHLPTQLGLSQSTLLTMALSYYNNRLINLQSSLSSISTSLPHASIGEIREILLQKLILTDHSVAEVESACAVLMSMYDIIKSRINNGAPTRDSKHYHEDVDTFIQWLNLGALIGNDIVQYTDANGNQELVASLLTDVRMYLVTLLNYVTAESSVVVNEMLVSHYNTVGAYYTSMGDTNMGIQYFDLSVQTFSDVEGGNIFRKLRPLQSLATAHCTTKNYEQGINAYYNATVIYFDLLKDEKQIKEDYRQFRFTLTHFSECVQRSLPNSDGITSYLAPSRSLNLWRMAEILLRDPLLQDLQADVQILRDYGKSDMSHRKAHKRKKRRVR